MAETNRPLANRILIGLAVGVIAGVASLALGRVWPDSLVFVRKLSTSALDPFGQIFLRMLFFVVIPLVFASLATFGVPPEGIGIVLGVDRVLDMVRTMTNVGSDVVTTVVVDAQEARAEAKAAGG